MNEQVRWPRAEAMLEKAALLEGIFADRDDMAMQWFRHARALASQLYRTELLVQEVQGRVYPMPLSLVAFVEQIERHTTEGEPDGAAD